MLLTETSVPLVAGSYAAALPYFGTDAPRGSRAPPVALLSHLIERQKRALCVHSASGRRKPELGGREERGARPGLLCAVGEAPSAAGG